MAPECASLTEVESLRELKEKERTIPISHECDVLVAGGGIAGIAAALAARRNGADVLLLEREYTLGGLATLGLITLYLPLCDGRGNQVIFGIGEELLRLSIKYGAEKNYPSAWLDGGTREEREQKRFMTQFNPHLFALEAERLLRETGVRILYGSLAADAYVTDGYIREVVIENKSGRSAIAVNKVIDATGDADLCNLSGAPVALYTKKSGLASWYYYLSGGAHHLKMFGLADIVTNETSGDDSQKNEMVDAISSTRYSGTDGDDLTRMVLDGHEKMLEDIMEQRKKDPALVPVTISSIPLMRMSRRLVGMYELDESEDHKFFPDSIGMTGDWRKRGPVFEIPFRCLYTDKINNLLTAGRDISVTDSMWDITRVIPPCAVTGQAAGTAAAMTSCFPELEVSALQKKLEEQNVRLHL